MEATPKEWPSATTLSQQCEQQFQFRLRVSTKRIHGTTLLQKDPKQLGTMKSEEFDRVYTDGAQAWAHELRLTKRI